MKNVFTVLLVSWWGLFVLPTRAPAEIPCDNYFGQGINHGHYMPTSDGTIGHYNALASQDGFAYAIVKGSISGSPVLLRRFIWSLRHPSVILSVSLKTRAP